MNARELAFRVVRDVFPPSDARQIARGAHAALDYRAKQAHASDRDVAFAAELAYGSIKMRRALDWYLAPFLENKQLPPAAHEVLRLGIYELVYTRPDEHATVFEFVNLAKRYGHRGLANLVNAVLRRFLRERPPAPQPQDFPNADDFLGTRYSLPTWLVRQWRAVFGERVEAICAGVNAPPANAVVVNGLRCTVTEAEERLASLGVVTQPSPFVPEALLLERGHAIDAADGAWWVQSESSAMVVDVLNPQPGEAILDVCSGRGNKALQIAARLAREGTLLCVDRDERKSRILAHRLEHAEAVAAIVSGDATKPLLPPGERFDRALIDAPCSGTGIVGRQPEARWKKQGTDGERLAIIQRGLLEQVARHVHPGGALVYAVCSTDPRETTEVMEWFLARENFERGLIPAAYEPLLTEYGDVLVPPGLDGRDGFFIARLDRRP